MLFLGFLVWLGLFVLVKFSAFYLFNLVLFYLAPFINKESALVFGFDSLLINVRE